MQKSQWTLHFSYHRYLRILFVIAAIIFGAFGLLSLTGSGKARSLPAGLLFLCFMAVSLFMLAWANRSFEIDQDGIHMRSWFGRQVSLRWADVARAESGAFDPGIKLTDYAGQTKISIDAWVSHYEQLVEQIRLARPDLWDTFGTTEFRRSLWLTAIGVLIAFIFFGLGISGLLQSEIAACVVFAGLGILTLYSILRLPQQICLQGNSLKVKYLVGERIIHARDISDISIAVERGIHGNSGATVNIILNDGKRIDLAGFSVGTPILANALRSWWERVTPQMDLEQVDKRIRSRVAEESPKLIRLHMAITESFDASQVGHICELLGANYSKLRGIANRDKIRELLLYLNRRGQLDDLVEICHQLQPGFHWEDRPLVLEIPAFAQHISLEDLSTILATHFSLDDLKQLAFCLGIEFEAIPAPHLMFGTTHNLSERSKQWLQSVGIDYNSMSAKELDARLNKMWVEGFVDECKRGADWKRAVAICAQLRPDVFG